MFSILNRALFWPITSFGNKFCLKKRSKLIKALDNRFYVKFVQLEIGLLHILKPGFNLQQTPRPRHKTQSDYVIERSSFTLIALFWFEIGRCRGRNWPYGNQA